jgi:hypothetical protein
MASRRNLFIGWPQLCQGAPNRRRPGRRWVERKG